MIWQYISCRFKINKKKNVVRRWCEIMHVGAMFESTWISFHNKTSGFKFAELEMSIFRFIIMTYMDHWVLMFFFFQKSSWQFWSHNSSFWMLKSIWISHWRWALYLGPPLRGLISSLLSLRFELVWECHRLAMWRDLTSIMLEIWKPMRVCAMHCLHHSYFR